MCQVCTIKQLAAKERWPKPVEASKKDLDFIVESVHDEWAKYETAKKNDTKVQPPSSLLDLLVMLSDQLDGLEADREIWWTSPEKRALRKKLDEECDQKRLSELHKINNACISSIEALSAKLGQFVRWSLNMKGGVWELKNGHKVSKA